MDTLFWIVVGITSVAFAYLVLVFSLTWPCGPKVIIHVTPEEHDPEDT